MINLMVDIETTGLDPTKNAIIQIGALPFDLNILAKGRKGFKMSLTIPSDRKWNNATKKWWKETNLELLNEITKNPTNFIIALTQFKLYIESFKDENMNYAEIKKNNINTDDLWLYLENRIINSKFKNHIHAHMSNNELFLVSHKGL